MNKQRLAELELKWLKGEISEDESIEYALWYNEGQNDQLQVPEDIADSKSAHRSKLWKNINQKLAKDINTEVGQSLKNRSSIPYFYPLTAACVLIMVALGFWMYNLEKPIPSNIINDVNPGHHGMIITLENGQQLIVDSLADGLLAIQDGVRIIKKQGIIYYEGKAKKSTFNTASTAKGRKFQLLLPDNSRVWLNAESSIKYPTVFSNDERRVEVKGEVYFEVASDPGKPFIVQSGLQQITVLGTRFNVNDYPNEDAVITTLLEGKVSVGVNRQGTIIRPNQQLALFRKTDEIRISNVKATDAIGWITDEFRLNNTDLATVMRQIERWYGVEVRYEDGVDKHQTFFGSTQMNQKLSEVLKVLQLSGVKSSIDGNIVVIHKN
ncbi:MULTISPECIES: FecR family protein [unclassified Sphingobacterium]|uniref:FecR family protein n=1 Tax=unclassified Sphingobacterium TaxID=2609468 RepID=UPI0025E1F06B|nr:MULTISPECIES: FecR family protein [unclassified Sphingobacterium]